MYRLKNMSKVKMPKFSPKVLSSGYKTTVNKSMSNSSFWLDTDMLSSPGSGKDIVKLAGYKRAIGNFVKILTKRDDIKVQFSSGQQSYTNGQLVVISAKIDDKEFDSTVGLALHESAHVVLTDFAVAKTFIETDRPRLEHIATTRPELVPDAHGLLPIDWAMNTYYRVRNEYSAFYKDIVNVIEDRRIDQYVFDNAPGYRGYYEAVYDRYFNSKVITDVLQARLKNKRTIEDYMFHIINVANPNRTPDLLPGLREIFQLIDLKNINRLTNTGMVCELADLVWKKIIENIDAPAAPAGSQPQPAPGEDEPKSGSNGEAPGAGDDEEDPNMDTPMGGSGSGQGEDTDDDGNGESGESGDIEDGEVKDPKQIKKEEQLMSKLEKEIERQKNFLNGDVKKSKVSKSEAAKINAAAESNMQYADATFNGQKIKVMNIKGLSERIIATELVPDHTCDPGGRYSDYYTKPNVEAIENGIRLGTLLGKRLKTRDENRSLLTTRLPQGSLDRRLIAELGFGNEKVFNKTLHQTVTPSLLYLSIDASGSMSGDKWKSALTASIAIAKAASMVSSVEVVIAIRGSFRAGNEYMPLNWEIYDSRKDRFATFKHLVRCVTPGGSTPESLCYDVVKKEIVKAAQGYETYFINVSDGAPGFSSNSGIDYGGVPAQEHAKKIMNEFRASGIKVLSYFVDSYYDPAVIKNTSTGRAFINMYGADAVFIDPVNLVQLSKTLNSLLERKA